MEADGKMIVSMKNWTTMTTNATETNAQTETVLYGNKETDWERERTEK